MQKDWQKGIEILKNDGVVVLPTDTLYGIIGSAQSKKVVEIIYKIKGRNENKPFIVLINSYKDLQIFGIKLDEKQAKFLAKIWPGKVSVILPCKLSKWKYIHKGEESIAFRMIGKKNKNLFDLINKIGPVVAPSCNKQGDTPAENIKKAKEYFENKIDPVVDLYVNGGIKKSFPSTLIKYENNDWVILRQGAVKIA
jgi:L-threonylcarbamoyladenylate synthase